MMYERPEILEVGQAQTLTLGTAGVNTDACGCSVPRTDTSR
ncbi:MAG TPA: hypothetical protein VF746_11125 [Longimicrobium sp.]|jgi:hypothetical protein